MLQLLDLARENAALKREVRRLGAELRVLEHALARALEILASTAALSDDGRPER